MMEGLIEILVENPLLTLFIVAGIGYPLGRIKIGGSSLGVAAVLFVGLAVGALDEELKLPEIIYLLGLVFFVYTIGLSSGPGFFRSFRGRGARNVAFAVAMIVFTAGLMVGIHYLLGLRPSITGGLFAGTLTNTPALAGVVEYLKNNATGPNREQLLADPVVAYSIAYPISVLGMIMMISLMQRIWKVDYAAEVARAKQPGATSEQLEVRTILITRPEATRAPIAELMRQQRWDVVFGRMKRDGELSLVGSHPRFVLDDLVTVVGTPEQLDQVVALLGEPSDERIELDRSEFDYRRIFVSNPRVAGHRLRELNLPQQYGAIVTRVRRGDIELLPHADTVLELGDRVRVVTRRDNMDAVSTFLGDSYKALSEIDILSFSLGLAVGMLIGLIPIPLPGGITIKLGLAGGPLVTAIVLGAKGRTGPLLWSLPYSANLMLRQVGLVCFLAGVGTRAGYAFFQELAHGNGLLLLGASAAAICLFGLGALWVGYRVLKIPLGMLLGMIAGIQTQPATLGFALEQTGNELPNIGYAMVFPAAVLLKIIVAQLLLLL